MSCFVVYPSTSFFLSVLGHMEPRVYRCVTINSPPCCYQVASLISLHVSLGLKRFGSLLYFVV